jgi:2-isopropylmalate synthase
MQLVDFKVRVVDGRDGTAAKVRVFIESRDQDQIWSTIGVSEDIIEASWQALADSFQFKLAKESRQRRHPSRLEKRDGLQLDCSLSHST